MINNPALEAHLLAREEFQYAHLIKFERPQRTDSGKASTSWERYTYITDAAIPLVFDDGSTDLLGNPNGPQTYIANKVLSVGDITEDVQAKASSSTLQLDGNGIGAYAFNNVNITIPSTGFFDIDWPDSVDLLEAGFREGDKVHLKGGGQEGKFNIHSFRAGNVLRVQQIDDALFSASGVSLEMTLASEEIVSILMNKDATDYASFINREVYIYRAYRNLEGQYIGNPVLLFKGIINNVSFEDDESRGIVVSWGLSSHWGDFEQVSGRRTSDDYHRALDNNGVPSPGSSVKPMYAYDKGFIHSDTSVNMLAKYSVQVEKQDVKAKSGFLGIGAKVKVKKYYESEDRHTELDFSLTSKHIPIVYGVRVLPGINVFADTLKNDSSTVYTVQAMCEGEIGGILDVYVDGESLICTNKADFDARSQQTDDNTVKLVCRGRGDRGDTLGGVVATSGPGINFYDTIYDNALNLWGNPLGGLMYYPSYTVPPEAPASEQGTGLVDGHTLTLTSPIDMTLDVFSGSSSQKAASSLVGIAKDGNFKIQQDYWVGRDSAEYWGPNHRLLDTAYVVNRFKISEGETTIPELEYVVRGKLIPCYNYDFSYEHDPATVGESLDNFPLGAYVNLFSESGLINSAVQIIDKWTFVGKDGALNHRVRFSTPPALGYVNGVPSITKFYMSLGGNTWTMITYNRYLTTGSVTSTIIASLASTTSVGGFAQLNLSDTPGVFFEGGVEGSVPFYSLVRPTSMESIQHPVLSNNIFGGSNPSSSALLTHFSYQTVTANSIEAGARLVSRNTVHVGPGNFTGNVIQLAKVLPRGEVKTFEARVMSHSNGVVTIDSIIPEDMIPSSGDSFRILYPNNDYRVSTNFAIQTLDYLTGAYGRGLDLEDDIVLGTALQTARECDETSKVSIKLAEGFNATTVAVGNVYALTQGGETIFQGRVSSYDGDNGYVEFDNVIGKLSYRWNSWRSYKVGQLVYNNTNLYRVTVAGIKATEPNHTSGTVNGLAYLNTLALTRLAGASGVVSLSVSTYGNPVQGFKDGAITSGYSLYDSDGIPFWRYAGWDSQDQRWVTRHQGNCYIDTSAPVLTITNSLLEHFDGILRYSGGKYYLEIEKEVEPEESVISIQEQDIVGRIRLTNNGTRSSYNALTVAYSDPGNKFQSRSISFFNSKYLKEDRNVPKSGNLSIPYITNYYNARVMADKKLIRSRFGLVINFSMEPIGLLLEAGKVVGINYSRYKWVDKKFRITTIRVLNDCSFDITAEEYDDEFYTSESIRTSANTGLSGSAANNSYPTPGAFSASIFDGSDETSNTIQLTWTNTLQIQGADVAVEIYRSDDDNLDNAVLITTQLVPSNSYKDIIYTSSTSSRYYWARYRVRSATGVGKTRVEYSPFTSGVMGETRGFVTRDAFLTNETQALAADESGVVQDYSSAITYLRVFEGGIDTSSTWTFSRANSAGVGSTLTTAPGAEYGKVSITSLTVDSGYVDITATKAGFASVTKRFTLSRIKDGASGGTLGVSSNRIVVVFDVSSGNPTPPSQDIIITAHKYGIAGEVQWSVWDPNGTPLPNSILTNTTGDTTSITTASYAANTLTRTGLVIQGSVVTPSGTRTDANTVHKIFNGAPGQSSHLAMLYQRSYSAPILPLNTLLLNMTTGAIAGSLESWRDNIGDANSLAEDLGILSAPMWVTYAWAVTADTTAALAPSSWSSPTRMVQDGVDGIDGEDGSLVEFVWRRSETIPDTPTGNGIPSGWFDNPPTTGAGVLWMSKSRQDTDGTLLSSWSTPVQTEGPPGVAGRNTASLFLFTRTATATPPLLNMGSLTYNFTTQGLTGTLGVWNRSMPTNGGSFRWMISATASSTTNTDVIAPSEWSAPSQISSDGIDGLNHAVISLYARGATAPANPTGTFTYTFSTGLITGGALGAWTTSPSPTNGLPLWVKQATAIGSGTTDTIAASEFSAPIKMVEDGAPGRNTASLFLFARTATSATPALNMATLTYDFTTQGLTGSLGSWSRSMPSSGGTFRWMTSATASSTTNTDTIATSEWAVASQISADGIDGLNHAVISLYARGATAPANPTGTFTYTFASGLITGGALGAWSTSPPATNGLPLWIKQATAIGSGTTDTIAAAEFSAAIKMVEDGAPGASAFGLVQSASNRYDLSVPGVVRKVSGGGAWNGSFRSLVPYTTGAQVSFRTPAIGGNSPLVGFSLSDSLAESTTWWTEVDYCVYVYVDGRIDRFTKGSSVILGPVGTAQANDIFTVSYDGRTARILRNGVELDSYDGLGVGTPLYVRGGMHFLGHIDNLSIAAMGGLGQPSYTLINSPANRFDLSVPGKVKKKDNAGGWQGSWRTLAPYSAGARIDFKLDSHDGTFSEFTVGFRESNTWVETNGYNAYDYAVHGYTNGSILRRAGSVGTTIAPAGSLSIGSALSVTYDGRVGRIFLNGTLIDTYEAIAPNKSFYIGGTAPSTRPQLTDIVIAPEGVIGDPATSLDLTTRSATVWAYANGVVVSWADAAGLLKVYSGDKDVTAGATLSASASGLTGTINTAANTPVAGQPKGYYRVTAMPGNTGKLTLTATYGGRTLSETFSVSKVTTGYEIVSALPTTSLFVGRIVFLTTAQKLYRYTSTGWTASVPTVDLSGQVTELQIANNAITAAKLAVEMGGGNLVIDGGLAQDPPTWFLYNNGGSGGTRTRTTGRNGGFAVQVTAGASPGTTLGIGRSPALVRSWEREKWYTISFYALRNSAATGITGAGLAWNNGPATVQTISNPLMQVSTYQRYIYRVKFSAGQTLPPASQIYITARGSWSTGHLIRIADIQVEEGEIATAYAPRPDEILPGTITQVEIANDAITAPKIAAGAVVAGKLAANSVVATNIQAGAIVAGKLATDSVVANNITANAVTFGKVAANAIDTNQLRAGAVVTDKIQAGAITAATLASTNVITLSAQIANGVITNAKIGNLQVDSAKIADLTVGTNKITGNAVNKIAYVSSTTSISFGSMPNQYSLFGVTFVKEEASSVLEIMSMAPMSGADEVRGVAYIVIRSGGMAGGIVSTYTRQIWVQLDGNGNTNIPFHFSTVYDTLPAGTWGVEVRFERTSSKACMTSGFRYMKVKEVKR